MTDENNEQQTQGGDQDEHRLIAVRREKLAAIRAQRNAYPNDFRPDSKAGDLQTRFAEVDKSTLEQRDEWARVAGRIMRQRGPFMVLQDASGQIQAYINRQTLEADLLEEVKSWDVGDIVGVSGPVHRSGKGDLYVNMHSASLLTKSLRPLPDKYHGLADREMRYRQRYVDLIMNEESRRVFRIRSKVIDALRDFLTDRDYLEVETPMMQVIPGGATARPFETYHNALELPMYLRVAPELYLKRLVVGGFERVFEINRNFRNEGLSTRHNPEFTMLEFYCAYTDYHELMDFTEMMIRYVAERAIETLQITYQGEEYDLSAPFVRMTVTEAILAYNPDLSAADLGDLERCRAIARALDIEVKESYGTGKLQIEIFEKTVEEKLRQPTFITAYPTEVSPLARCNDDDPEVTDRFELFIGGRELANGFSELNDSEDQAQRFAQQVEDKQAGDEEAMHFDADYITALEYGLPPTGGEGLGIDRLVMFLTDSASIRDVLFFPHMRPLG